MRVVMLQAPQDLIEERRKKGQDLFDEVWDGVLHMVPQPSSWHQLLGAKLVAVLLPWAESRGLLCSYETTLSRPGLSDRDYRVPDLVVFRPEQRKQNGLEGADIAFELLSPGDESYDKLPFYADLGVREIFVIEPDTRRVELFLLRGKTFVAATPDDSGTLRSSVLGVAFAALPGPKLRVSWSGGEAVI